MQIAKHFQKHLTLCKAIATCIAVISWKRRLKWIWEFAGFSSRYIASIAFAMIAKATDLQGKRSDFQARPFDFRRC